MSDLILPSTPIERPEVFTAEILPNSRARNPTGAKYDREWGCWCVPIFCAYCGVQGGDVPEDGYDFAYWVCKKCWETPAARKTAKFVIPDEVYWETIKHEQMEKFGRLLSPHELKAVVDSDTSPLATLIKQGHL